MLGQPISRSEINNDVKRYCEFHRELSLKGANLSAAAKEFYSASEISFVFEKKDVDDLFSRNKFADALRIYYGSHADGTPTLILVAAKVFQTAEGKPGVLNIIDNDESAGYQWPTGLCMKSEEESRFDVNADNG